ncbi:MAG: hypothetical protein AAGD10_15445 [Myxococcota bacterium]
MDGLLRISTRPGPRSSQPPRRARPSWLDRLERAVLQDPGFATRPSLLGLERLMWSMARPGAVFMGIGLCSARALSRGLPIDVLQMLLAAERLRVEVGAPTTVVLVADQHAELNAFEPEAIRRRADVTVRTLLRVRARLGLSGLCVLRASSLASDPLYRQLLEDARVRAGARANAYALRQAVDVAYMHRALDGIIKLGWVLSRQRVHGTNLDEVAFDQWVQDWTCATPAFAYTASGRVLDDRAPKAAPYVEVSPSRRVMLDPREDVAAKLAGAAVSRSTLNGVKNQLRTLAQSYTRMVEPLRGNLGQRTQLILQRLYGPRRAMVGPLPRRGAEGPKSETSLEASRGR